MWCRHRVFGNDICLTWTEIHCTSQNSANVFFFFVTSKNQDSSVFHLPDFFQKFRIKLKYLPICTKITQDGCGRRINLYSHCKERIWSSFILLPLTHRVTLYHLVSGINFPSSTTHHLMIYYINFRTSYKLHELFTLKI